MMGEENGEKRLATAVEIKSLTNLKPGKPLLP